MTGAGATTGATGIEEEEELHAFCAMNKPSNTYHFMAQIYGAQLEIPNKKIPVAKSATGIKRIGIPVYSQLMNRYEMARLRA